MGNIKIILTFCFAFISCNIYSQARRIKSDVLLTNASCARVKNYDFKSRLEMFPLKSTSQIIIVAHRTKDGELGEELQKYLNSIKIGQDTLNLKEFEEVKMLNLSQIERLTDVIFNYSHKGKYYVFSDVKCYEPRNAIIFLDYNNKVLGFIEICFGCDHLRTSDKRINIGDFCTEKYNLIRDIFLESRIKYGITEVE